jgi:hypothetical protein
MIKKTFTVLEEARLAEAHVLMRLADVHRAALMTDNAYFISGRAEKVLGMITGSRRRLNNLTAILNKETE